MTDWTLGLAVLSAALLVAVSLWLWRRWDWPAVVGLWGVAVGVVGAMRRRVPEAPRAPSTPQDVHRARARKALRDAERAREAAERIAADIDTAGDAEALTRHLVRRSQQG